MFSTNSNLFFIIIIIFSQSFHWISSSTIELKFFISNLPSLIRCERNDPLFYFSHFPTENELIQAGKKKNSRCDSIVSSIDSRTKVQFNQLELSCDNLHEINDVNTFIIFSSKCSKESCRGFLPESAHILRSVNADNTDRIHRNLYIHYSHSNEIIFQESTNDRVEHRVWCPWRSFFVSFLEKKFNVKKWWDSNWSTRLPTLGSQILLHHVWVSWNIDVELIEDYCSPRFLFLDIHI